MSGQSKSSYSLRCNSNSTQELCETFLLFFRRCVVLQKIHHEIPLVFGWSVVVLEVRWSELLWDSITMCLHGHERLERIGWILQSLELGIIVILTWFKTEEPRLSSPPAYRAHSNTNQFYTSLLSSPHFDCHQRSHIKPGLHDKLPVYVHALLAQTQFDKTLSLSTTVAIRAHRWMSWWPQ